MEDFFNRNHHIPLFTFNSSDVQEMSCLHETSSLSSLRNSDFSDFDFPHYFCQDVPPSDVSVMEIDHEHAPKVPNASNGYDDSVSQSRITSGVDKERLGKQAAGRTGKQKKAIQESQPKTRVKRGHATDSHSIAERERRQKIKSRMKLLQSMIPGCDQIRGKIQILDEIIGYIQTLQNQVELQAGALAQFVNPMPSDFKEHIGTSAFSAEMLRSSIVHTSSSDAVAPDSANPFLEGNCGYYPNLLSQDLTQNNFGNNL